MNFAETRIQGVSLRPVIGAYELVFSLYTTIHADESARRRASITGARITAKTARGKSCGVGFARPETPFEIRAHTFSSSMTPSLTLMLQPGQLSAIENLRGEGDIDFELLATGIGLDENGEQQVQDTWRVHIPRSDWIKKLREAGARDTLLLEVRLPLAAESDDGANLELRRAEEHFRNGDYRSCIASCRTAVQELGHQAFGKKNWAGPLISRLASERSDMGKDERESALWGVLRHYTHQAHHAGGEGGVSAYTRSEAQFVLILTATFAARSQTV